MKPARRLKSRFTRGFVYSDGWVDDARLVALNAIAAADLGATVLTRWRCADARREADAWRVTLDNPRGERRSLTARALVNAAGPWAAQFLGEHAHLPHDRNLRLVKGSHIVVPKLFEHQHAYIFQNPDKRIIFAIPYEHDFTLIGTTDVEHHGEIGGATIDDAEIAYLCEQASRYFAKPVMPADVVWTYSGVRPLLDDESGDPSAVTRDYSLELDTSQAPLLTVWGGKITTFRKLAEDACALLAPPLRVDPKRGAWTHGAFLPGGDLAPWIGPPVRPDTDFDRFEQAARRRFPQFSAAVLHRLARAYGARLERVIGDGDGDRRRDRARPVRVRTALPARARMGAHRRRRAVAPQQAGAALFGRRTRRGRDLVRRALGRRGGHLAPENLMRTLLFATRAGMRRLRGAVQRHAHRRRRIHDGRAQQRRQRTRGRRAGEGDVAGAGLLHGAACERRRDQDRRGGAATGAGAVGRGRFPLPGRRLAVQRARRMGAAATASSA